MSMLSRYASLTAPAAAIQYVGGTSAAVTGSTATTTNVSLTSLTGGLASAPADGDVVIVYYGVGSTADRNLSVTTSGYIEVADIYANDTFDANLSVSYKRMTSTPDTQVTVSATGATGDAGAVAIHVWRGVDSVVVFDTAAITATGTNSVLCNPGAITPVTAGTVIVAGGAGAHNAGVQTFTSSDLSNFVTLGGPNSTNDVTVGLGSKTWTSGAFNPAAFGFSAADNAAFSWAAVTLALLLPQTQIGPIAIAQASTQNSVNTSTTLIINKPTGTQQGDLMVAFLGASATTSNFFGGGGFTGVAQDTLSWVGYKVAGASEASSYTFTIQSGEYYSGTIVTYRNAAYDAIGSSSSVGVASAVASAPYARFIGLVDCAEANISVTPPASMQKVTADVDSTEPTPFFAQDISLSPAGASGNRVFNDGISTTNTTWVASVKPAASYTKYANYTASNSANTPNGSTVSVSTPSCVPSNLLLFVVAPAIATATDVTVSTPSGWTLLSGDSTTTTAFQPGMYVFYRVADGTEAASYTATASTTCQLVAVIVALGGVDSPTLTAGTTNTGSATTAIAANAVTATANGVLLYFGAQANNNQGAPTFTPPSGMTEALESSVNTSSADIALEVAYQEGLSAGSTGTKTGTSSTSAGTNRFRAILVTVGAK